jgi:predicted nucleic acid-binding protein
MSLYHLDADWLIAIAELYHDHHEEADTAVKSWLMDGHQVATSAVAWSEFLTGRKKRRSVDDAMRCENIINGGIVEFCESEAEIAADLFNHVGRPRAIRMRLDCLIAASAIVADAELATFNLDDFKRFVPFGLRIVGFAILAPAEPKDVSPNDIQRNARA